MQKPKLTKARFLGLIILVVFLLGSCATSPASNKEVTLSDLVIKGDIEGIRKFYSNQEQLNKADNQGLYPLHYAVMKGDVQIAEILIVLAQSRTTRISPENPVAVRGGQKQADMVKMLVDRVPIPSSLM
jgi:hypothetical protein